LLEIVRLLDRLDLVPAIRAQADLMFPWVVEDPRRAYTPESVTANVNATIAFLERRRQDVGVIVDCLLQDDPDPDDDGFACDTDCRPDDPDSYPGAEEICGDGIDQDCNGVVDDGIGCPDCAERFRGGRRYLVCTTPRSYADARAHCQQLGADLVILDDPAEAAWAYARSQEVRAQDYWLGLDDIATEGDFRWVDGRQPTY
ncbi:MAG: hypothetical protein KC620_26995, partial [Myxococcales bacterium]|nr:hypothetical protein [Myxococcales bacterium]